MITSKGCPKGQVKVVSHSGKALSKCGSRKAAKRRLQQVEYFKHKKGA